MQDYGSLRTDVLSRISPSMVDSTAVARSRDFNVSRDFVGIEDPPTTENHSVSVSNRRTYPLRMHWEIFLSQLDMPFEDRSWSQLLIIFVILVILILIIRIISHPWIIRKLI